MRGLTDLEFRILDELYFVTSFKSLVASLHEDETFTTEALKNLLAIELITQLIFDPEIRDYRKLDKPDFEGLRHSCFVASKKGLLIHNSRFDV